MSVVQFGSPAGDPQNPVPSPTYSDSTLSSSSHLFTPDNAMTTVGANAGKRKENIFQSINAANAAFLSATERNDMNHMFSHTVSDIDPNLDHGSHSLAAALKFDNMSAEMQQALNDPNFSFLDRRPSSSQNSHQSSMLHTRTDSNTGRRHSIQPLMPSSDSSSSLTEYSGMTDINARSMSFSVESSSSFGFSMVGQQMGSGIGSEYLMSPPRLTVSMSSGSTPTPTPLAEFSEDAKRRRTAQVDTTPERSVHQLNQMQYQPQQTPPNMYAYQQHPHFSMGGSSVTMGIETPSTTAGTNSVQSSASSSRVRRLSLSGTDRALHLLNLTANLFLPGHGGSATRFDNVPKSAHPRAASDAMRVAQAQMQSRSTPTKQKTDKISNSNDLLANSNSKNQDVWPDDVEVAFWEALRLIPKLGRRKVLVHGKPCGRNELIADYIERKTNKVRSRKQVSSHIQVLKNIRKGDPEFQQLIAEPTTEEDFYIPAGGMMYAQTLAGYGYGGLGGSFPHLGMDNGGLLSPYSPGFSGGQGLASPITPGAPPMSATRSITSGLNNLHLPTASNLKNTSENTPCPILPASFSMWVHCSSGDEKHVYTDLDRNSMTVFANNQQPLPQMTLDSVRVGHFRFPRLAEMYHHMPCQFLHVHVPMSVPRHDVMMPRYDHFSTQLSLTSAQDLRLTSVTTVYSHGKRVLSLVEPLDPPRRISGRSGVESGPTGTGDVSMSGEDGTATLQGDEPLNASGELGQRRESHSSGASLSPVSNTSSGPTSPRTPLDVNNSANSSLRHRWCHQAPFATDFWADFLSRNHPVNVYNGRDGLQSFGKEPSERAALGMAVSGVTIIQELVVANEDAKNKGNASENSDAGSTTLLGDPGSGLSPGSKVGDVVLVIAWDLECVEALGTSPGNPTVSLLTVGNGVSPLGQSATLPSALYQGAHNMNMPISPMNIMPGLSPMSAYPGVQNMSAQQLQHLHHHQQHQQHQQQQQQQHHHHHHHQQQQQQQQQQSQQTMDTSTPHGFTGEAPALFRTQPSPQIHRSIQPEHQMGDGNQRTTNLNHDGGLQAPTLLRKRGLSMNKPNLMVSIPPAPTYLNVGKAPNSAMLSPHPELSPAMSPTPVAWGLMQQRAVRTPITPFPQVAQTLCHPPPLNSGDEARMQRERLERFWATQADPTAGPLPSPLDMRFEQSADAVSNIPTLSANMAAVGGHRPSDSALGLMVPGTDASGDLLSPAAFDLGGKLGGMGSGNNSFESMMLDHSMSHDANTQQYLNGLLASIGVEGQNYKSDA